MAIRTKAVPTGATGEILGVHINSHISPPVATWGAGTGPISRDYFADDNISFVAAVGGINILSTSEKEFSADDQLIFNALVGGINELNDLSLYASTTPYPYIPDKDLLNFTPSVAGVNRMFFNPTREDIIDFAASVAGINTLTQLVVSKTAGTDNIDFTPLVAGTNTLNQIVISKTAGTDSIDFTASVAGTNTLMRVVLEDDAGSDSITFTAPSVAGVNTLTTI